RASVHARGARASFPCALSAARRAARCRALGTICDAPGPRGARTAGPWSTPQRRAAACFSLRASEACQGWSSLALLEENATQRFSYNPDPASFDSAIRSIVGSVRDVEEFRRFWSCPAYDGSSQRYRLSFLCAEIVLAANNTRSCNSPPSSPL
ncbi:MAG: hypothetical protein BJ554DRAFT_4812, partial [Olpidium bornovanus]